MEFTSELRRSIQLYSEIRGLEPATNPVWYRYGGAPVPLVLYTPYAFGSLTESLVNVVNPGTYDPTNGILNYPALLRGKGWDFHSVPTAGIKVTIPITHNSYYVIMVETVGHGGSGGYGMALSGDTTTYGIYPNTVDHKAAYMNGAYGTGLVRSPITTKQVVAMVGRAFYVDGDRVGIVASAAPSSFAALGLGNIITGNMQMDGYIYAFALYPSLTEAQAVAVSNALLAEVNGFTHPITKITTLGHSIPFGAYSSKTYSQVVAENINEGWANVTNRAVSGAQVVNDNFAQQAALAAGDDADIIFVDFGLNDQGLDMDVYETKYRAGLAALKASNTDATIYALNLLPAWTDNMAGPELDLSVLRARTAAACLAEGVTCWDTRTVPWILQSDTHDGWHPETAGHAKIAAQILARL